MIIQLKHLKKKSFISDLLSSVIMSSDVCLWQKSPVSISTAFNCQLVRTVAFCHLTCTLPKQFFNSDTLQDRLEALRFKLMEHAFSVKLSYIIRGKTRSMSSIYQHNFSYL